MYLKLIFLYHFFPSALSQSWHADGIAVRGGINRPDGGRTVSQGQGFWGQLVATNTNRDRVLSGGGPQYTEQGRSYANTKEILSDATLKPAAHQLSKPPTTASRRMDYDDDYEYYYDEDYDDYEDFTYHDKPSSLDRRHGELSEQEELLELAGNNRKLTKEKVTKSGAVNTIAVLDMINSLQEEIKDINKEIEKENAKIDQLRRKKINGDSEAPLRNAATVSTEETVKELNLQKEDTTMKKVMAQMMLMKKIQKKKEENNKLELALRKLSERRKIINAALKKQKSVASEKRLEAQRELERQKQVMREKEELIIKLKEEEDKREIISEEEEKEELKKKKENAFKLLALSQLQKKGPKASKLQLLEAHKRLVDKSNERILAKIEELKLQREKESVGEQEKLLREQTQAIQALRKLRQQRLRKQKQKIDIEGLRSQLQQRKKTAAKLQLPKSPSSASALLNLSDEEKKQVAAWLDLERNAPILQKTDRAIAAKLNVKTADLTLGSGTGLSLPAAGGRVKSAAQVLSEGDITDAEIDAILGIDEGLSDDDDPTIIQLDDDALLFEDYEYEDDFGDDYDDYEEIIYEYEYEDAETPEIIVEYEYVDEEPPPPPPKYKPSYRPQPRPSYHHQSSLHGHRLPPPSYPKPAPQTYRPRPQYRPQHQQYQSYSQPRPALSGPEFLESVSGLLERAENTPPHITLSGSLRSALLQGVEHRATAELQSQPGGHRNYGRPRHQAHHGRVGHRQPHHSPVSPSVPGTFSNLMERGNQGAHDGRGATFGQLVGDMLVGKPRIPGIA